MNKSKREKKGNNTPSSRVRIEKSSKNYLTVHENSKELKKKTLFKSNIVRFLGKLIRIILRIRKNLKYTNIDNLNNKQLEIINDYAYYREPEKKGRISNKVEK